MTTLNDEFRKEIMQILDKATKVDSNTEPSFRSLCGQKGNLHYPKELAPTYLRTIRLLRRKINNSKRLLSDEALEDKLDDFIIDLVYLEDQKKVKQELNRYIKKFFREIVKIQSTNYLFLIPIMGLGIEGNFSINDITIMRLTEDNLLDIEKRYSIKTTNERCKTLSETISLLKKENETDTIALVQVQAVDKNKAFELALEKTNNCLNILRLYWRINTFVIRDEYKKEFREAVFSFDLTHKGAYSRSFTTHNQFIAQGIYIEEKHINKIEKSLQKIQSITTKKECERTELENCLVTAIFWHGNGVKEPQKSMQFVAFVMALEALLLPDGVSAKKQNIAKRFASIVFCNKPDSQKKDAFLTMRSYYELRNTILHSGGGYVYDDDLFKIAYWVRCTIRFLLKQTDRYSSLKTLIENEFPINHELYDGL